MLLLAFFGVAASLAVNDYCTQATAISNGGFIGNNNNALQLSQTPYIEEYDVFYVYNATLTGSVNITVQSTSVPQIYLEGVAFYGNTCNNLGLNGYYADNQYGTSFSLVFNVVKNRLYYVAVGSETGYGTGSYSVSVFPTLAVGQPANDDCSAAHVITDGVTLSSTSGASTSLYTYCGYNDVWYVYNASCTGDATAILNATGIDVNVGTWWDPEGCGRILASSRSSDWRDCAQSDQALGTPATTTFPVFQYQLYYLQVSSYFAGSSYQGNFNLTLSCAAPANPRPSNDQCSGAVVPNANTGAFVSDTNYASQQIYDRSCQHNNEVWVAYNATCTGNVTFAFNGTIALAAYKGGGCTDNALAFCDSGSSSFSWAVNQGDQFFVAIGDYQNYYTATVSCVSINGRAANTACAGATNLTIGVSTVSINTLNNTIALTDAKTNNYLAEIYQSTYFIYNQLYFQIRPPCNGQIDIVYGACDTVTLALYQDNTCSANPVVYATYGGSLTLTPVLTTDVYTFGIGQYYVNYGSIIQVNVTCTPAGSTSQPTIASTYQPTTAGTTLQPTIATTGQPTTAGTTLHPTIATTGQPTAVGTTGKPTTVGTTLQPTTQTSPTNAPTLVNETSPTVVSDATLVTVGAATFLVLLM